MTDTQHSHPTWMSLKYTNDLNAFEILSPSPSPGDASGDYFQISEQKFFNRKQTFVRPNFPLKDIHLFLPVTRAGSKQQFSIVR